MDVDTHVPTSCLYFRNFITILFDFYSIFPIRYHLFSQIFRFSFDFVRFWSSMTQPHRHWIASRALIGPNMCRLIAWRLDQPTFDNRCSGVRQLRSNSEIGRTNRSIRTIGSTHAETSQTRYPHDNEPPYYISEVDLQKLLYLDRLIRHWLVFHSKILFTAL